MLSKIPFDTRIFLLWMLAPLLCRSKIWQAERHLMRVALTGRGTAIFETMRIYYSYHGQ